MPRAIRPPLDRLWARSWVNLAGCWLCRGLNSSGYASVAIGSRTDGTHRSVGAHIWSYEHFVGPVPPGHDVDHICRVRNCWNPEHLRPLPRRTNRGEHKASMTHCGRGHEFTPENTYVHGGKRFCRTCGAARARRYRCD